MNIGDFCGSARPPPAAMPTSARLLTSPLSSKSLSLALQTGTTMEGQMGEHHQINGYDNLNNINGGRRSRDDDRESRSGSDNAASGDDQDADGKPPRKKRYHRHTPHQIQELEAMFKECPHPDEKQRLELSTRLCLDPRQVKFWFQNRRTQMKTQLERHENSILRAENDKLRAENMSIREAMRSPSCTNCGGPAIIGEISIEEQHLRIENARLKDELDRVCALAGKFLGRPVALELGVGNNGYSGLLVPPQFGVSVSSPLPAMDANSAEKSVYLELALAAMDVLVKMARSDEPLWLRRAAGGGSTEVLNHDEYRAMFTRCTGLTMAGFTAEASRESGVVIINSLALVETLMDPNKWAEMFPCIIAKSSTTALVSTGMGGTRNGSLQLMNAAFQVLSPLVPVREFNFLRFCKQHADGVWAVVDVSIDAVQAASGAGFPSCMRLPSGCVVEDMPNGYSKVTWVEHVEYDESVIHQLYRPLVSAGLGFGARRWVATLQRQCECLAILMSSNIPAKDHSVVITTDGRRSMLKLAQRMTNSFCAGISASSSHKWSKLCTDNVDDNVQVMTRKSVDEPGEPPGIVVSAATSVWLPMPPQGVFDFLRDERLRSKWDILSNGGPMQEMARIAKSQDPGNSVSLLRASAGSMLILQETSTDAAGSLVVYAPVDIPAMHLVMNGGDSSYVALLPSGFSIAPDGGSGGGGSLLTVAFQILVNSLPTAKLTVESVETVNNLISCTIEKIRAALRNDGDHTRLT